MPQVNPEDFPIDPTVTSGTALADILNRLADAIGTNNSGATAPSDTLPGMFWLDTSGGGSGVLKMRNGSNTGWITLSDMSGDAPALSMADGTVAAPGLAFSSEPGLGMYRSGAAKIGWAAGGARMLEFNAAETTGTYLVVAPRAAGHSDLQMWSDPAAAQGNTDYFQITKNAAGTILKAGAVGTGVPKSINFQGAPAYNFDSGVRAGTFLLDSNYYLGLISGDPLINFDTNDYLQYARASNQLVLTRASGVQTRFSASGDFHAGRNVFCGNGDYPALITQDAAVRRIQFSADGWRLDWIAANGSLAFVSAAGSTLFNVSSSGNATCAGNCIVGGAFVQGGTGSDFYINRGGGFRSLNFGANWAYRWQEGDGSFQWLRNGSIDMALAPAGLDLKYGNGFKPGGGDWAATSDVRVKNVLGDYESGLAQILALRPRRYVYKSDPNREFIGLVAQEAKDSMPEMIEVREGEMGGIALPDMHYLDTTPLTFAMVNAIKELAGRVDALEGAGA